MHRPLFVITAGSVAACGALIFASALPAAAATATQAETMARTYPCVTPNVGDCADTPVTFSVTSIGTLNITAPTATDDLGFAQSSSTSTTTLGTGINFGAVTVTDYRSNDPSPWVASVSSTDFTSTPVLGGTTDTIPASAATYGIPAITADLPSGLPLAGNAGAPGSITNDTIAVDAPSPFALSNTPAAVVTEAGADGDNAATWSPTLTVTVPVDATVGTYSGTITHSVT
jgi:hypothetical protein